jgi:hypothetical protein
MAPDFDLDAVRAAFGACGEMHVDHGIDDRAIHHGYMAVAAAEGARDLINGCLDIERSRPSILSALQLATEHAAAACRIEGKGDPAKAKAWRLLHRLLSLELRNWSGR